MHSSTKVRLMSKSTIRHFWNANWHFQSAEWNPFELWPNSLRVPIRHILFDLFAERHVPICTLLVVAYFLSIFYFLFLFFTFFNFFLNFFESIVEIESCFLQLSISTIHKYCIKQVLHLISIHGVIITIYLFSDNIEIEP